MPSALPGLGLARQEALKTPSAHEVNDVMRLSFSSRCDFVTTSQLATTVEVAGDQNMKAQLTTMVSRACCVAQ